MRTITIARRCCVALFIIISLLMAWEKAWAAVPRIAAGGYHTIGLKSDGTLWAWGYNSSGQLGDGTLVNKSAPVQITTVTVTADTSWVSVSAGAGGNHTIGLKSDGTLWAWGYNGSGQLGDGTLVNKSAPVQIGTDTKWVSIAAGWGHPLEGFCQAKKIFRSKKS